MQIPGYEPEMKTHLSLFSGIGGIDIAAEWAGFKTVCFVENNEYCQRVLRKHWPDVPIIGDIRDVTKEKVMAYTEGVESSGYSSPIICQRDTRLEPTGSNTRRGNIQTGNRAESTINLITGGFPCQPFSVAGKRQGEADDRYLWPEMLRVIQELKPTWVCGENVAGIIHMGLDTVLSDLERSGYQCQALVIPACAVNAPHRRDRVFIVGHSSSVGLDDTQAGQGVGTRNNGVEKGQDQLCQPERTGCLRQEDVADTKGSDQQGECDEGQGEGEFRGCGRKQYDSNSHSKRLEGLDREGFKGGRGEQPPRVCKAGIHWSVEPRLGGMVDGFSDWTYEPDIPRVATGVKNRVDRLRTLGNAVVPQQIYPVLKAIADSKMETICR